MPERRYSEFADRVAVTSMEDGWGATHWQGRRLVIAHGEDRAQRQHTARREAMARVQAEGEHLAKRLDHAEAGQPQRGRQSTDRKAHLRFSETIKAAGLSRILKVDLTADRFCFDLDAVAPQEAEQLDGKLLLVTNTHFFPIEVIKRYQALAEIERGFHVLKSDLDIAPVYHRLPERLRAHAMICFLALVLYRGLRE